MSGFAAFNHLIRWTVGQTTTLEYCDSHFHTLIGREKTAHDNKYQIHWSLTHLITGLKEDRQTEAVVRLHIVNVQTQEQILPSGRASNAVLCVWVFFLKGHLVICFVSERTTKHTHRHKNQYDSGGTAARLTFWFLFCFFCFPSCYKNVISECSVTSSLNGFQPWDYFSIEYGVYG